MKRCNTSRGPALYCGPLACHYVYFLCCSQPCLDRDAGRVLAVWSNDALLALNVPGLAGWILLATAKAGTGFLAQMYAGRLLLAWRAYRPR